ncbi:MAG: methylmalonyl-CoA mutase [Alphaproteobacteria bacterium RIFCSPHIGHO2_12_FULL_63_12]|nr:MAG: methylmalonyl-CoA mutase [Alphaproteobacteria bacterium RIFCSPHIGHO2_12_FULL_63_12]
MQTIEKPAAKARGAAVRPRANKVRFVTATSLFDGHDAAINIMRRILQASGAEVIHLGHNRSVDEIINAAIQEDVQGVAVSSYQGGHIEYFKYMVDLLRERGAGHIKVFGGGGGVISREEIKDLHAYGVERIYSPEDGQKMGLQGMIDDMIARADFSPASKGGADIARLGDAGWGPLARFLTQLEEDEVDEEALSAVKKAAAARAKAPVLGVTGTGGSGKSSLCDEIITRFKMDAGEFRIAVLAIDPSRRKSGGALLGDRIRMNSINAPQIYFRSIATRESDKEVPPFVHRAVDACRAAGFNLIIVETPGIGQGNAAIADLADISLYVMTPEFGAASQLEKIDMLDFADIVAINKFDRKGAEDALRDVRKQVQRNRQDFTKPVEDMPVYGAIAARYQDDGATGLYIGLREAIMKKGFALPKTQFAPNPKRMPSPRDAIVPPSRQRYLAEIASDVRGYHDQARRQATLAREIQQLKRSREMLEQAGAETGAIAPLIRAREERQDTRARNLIENWPQVQKSYAGDEYVVKIRDKEIRTKLTQTTLSGTKIRKVVLPRYEDHGELLKWMLLENLPGSFPYTAGVFAFKREGEDPTRMFAGEGDPFRTNARFKFLSKDSDAKRLSTAFDSVTLYGFDPNERPDIYGKVGNSGVSVATLDDMKALFDGFDLCSPSTSVSMTINGPAPMILAMFLNTAIDQQLAKFESENKRRPTEDEANKVRAWALETVRGTVQADILKEDQGQNTCIFSTEFALKMMGDIQEFFVEHRVRNFYSVSISGYHIAEAGANPISQLAFTLSNGFTFVESYLARGMKIDDFAPNLSYFFSNGMDPEYSVIGRVARRIWAIAMRERYGANERSQKLKYHVQTSGRSLHAQEMDFNDIRTTLQALIAIYDNCNSLHTNAYDEAYTTPTEHSVRRAMAIQMIINREWGLSQNENPNQGAFIIDELTDLVEEAVLKEFERIAERGGVLGAMETGYQRGKIQEESLYYEHKKHDGSLPIIGVNTFINPEAKEPPSPPLQRSTTKEKDSQIARLRKFQARDEKKSAEVRQRLRDAVVRDQNVFAVLMEAVKYCSLGQISDTLFEVGGQYRRNM